MTPAFVDEAGDTAVFGGPGTSPQNEATTTLMRALRSDVVPGATDGTGATVLVGGATAAFSDIGDRMSERPPYLLIAVIGLSLILLMAVFRSVVVALKAAILNLLSIGAAYGVVVAVFQFGWGASLIGVDKGPVETFLPMMMFAVLFGLSMDYEVFLISRIREEYLKVGDNSTAVANAGGDGAGDHGGSGDHGRGVPGVRAGGRARNQGVRDRTCDRDLRGRDDRAAGARAIADGASGGSELVDAEMARPDHPADQCRGRTRRARADRDGIERRELRCAGS